MFINIASVLCLCFGAALLWVVAPPQLAAAYSFCLTGLVTMATSTAIAWYRRPYSVVLPDVGHDLLPEVLTMFGMNAHLMCDNLLRCTVTATVVLVCTRSQRSLVFKRVLIVYGTLMFLRAFTLLLTSLPDPYFLCSIHPKAMYGWREIPWSRIPIDVLTLFGPNKENSMTCGDLFFSGHTVLFVLCSLVWHTYYHTTRVQLNPVKLSVWLLSLVGTLLLLVTRMHWTIDIAVAYYITITCWNFYHSVCNSLSQEHYMKPVIFIDGALIYPFVAWLESGVSYTVYQRENEERRLKKENKIR